MAAYRPPPKPTQQGNLNCYRELTMRQGVLKHQTPMVFAHGSRKEYVKKKMTALAATNRYLFSVWFYRSAHMGLTRKQHSVFMLLGPSPWRCHNLCGCMRSALPGSHTPAQKFIREPAIYWLRLFSKRKNAPAPCRRAQQRRQAAKAQKVRACLRQRAIFHPSATSGITTGQI